MTVQQGSDLVASARLPIALACGWSRGPACSAGSATTTASKRRSGAPAPSLQALFAYEAMASLLTRVAATERGATLLVDRGVLASIARSTLLARAAEIDAAILALPISDPNLTETPLFTEDFVLVRPKQDADLPVPDGEALQKMRLLLLEEGHCFRDQALAFCHTDKTLPRDGLDGSSLTTLVQMVSAGIGVTLIPEMAIAVETGAAQVCVAAFPEPRPTRQIGMIWRKSNPLSAQLTQVAHVVKQTIAK